MTYKYTEETKLVREYSELEIKRMCIEYALSLGFNDDAEVVVKKAEIFEKYITNDGAIYEYEDETD